MLHPICCRFCDLNHKFAVAASLWFQFKLPANRAFSRGMINPDMEFYVSGK
jgi:hypothetical protein